MNGTVKNYGKRGFGFIQGEDDLEYFVHQSDIQMEGFRFLVNGEKVEFEIATNVVNNKEKAVNVKRIMEVK